MIIIEKYNQNKAKWVFIHCVQIGANLLSERNIKHIHRYPSKFPIQQTDNLPCFPHSNRRIQYLFRNNLLKLVS